MFSGLQVYLAQEVWPDYYSFSNPETAFFDVSGRVGGSVLFNLMALVLLIASIDSGLAGRTIATSILLSYQTAAELLNFGAFLAFMGVNAGSADFLILATKTPN